MRNDSLGHVVNNNDIIVVFKKHYPRVEIGVMIKDKIRTESSIESAVISSNFYLLQNPTKEEEKIRDNILVAYNNLQNKKKEKIKKKGKPQYATLIGGVYSTDQDKFFLYLGNLIIEKYDKDNNLISSQKGNCYKNLYMHYDFKINEYKYEQKNVDEYTIKKFCDDNNFQFNKGFKRINGLCGTSKYFKNVSNVIGTFEYKYWDTNTHQYEVGKKIIKENTDT